MIAKRLFSMIVISGLLLTAKPFDETDAFAGGMLGGTVAAAATAYVVYKALDQINVSQTSRDLATAVVGAGVGAVVTYVIYKQLHTQTQAGMLSNMQEIIQKVESDLREVRANSLVAYDFVDDNDFLCYCRLATKEKEPLYRAALSFVVLKDILKNGEAQLDIILKTKVFNKNSQEYNEIVSKSTNLKNQIALLLKKIEDRHVLVMFYDDYEHVENIIAALRNDHLLLECPSDNLNAQVTMIFGTNWPLLLAQRHLSSIVHNDINNAKNILVNMSRCLMNWHNGQELETMVLRQNQIISELSTALESKMASILQHPDYNLQVNFEAQYCAQENQQKHELEMAKKEYDYELKWQREERKEKERQRQHEKTMLEMRLQRDRERVAIVQ